MGKLKYVTDLNSSATKGYDFPKIHHMIQIDPNSPSVAANAANVPAPVEMPAPVKAMTWRAWEIISWAARCRKNSPFSTMKFTMSKAY